MQPVLQQAAGHVASTVTTVATSVGAGVSTGASTVAGGATVVASSVADAGGTLVSEPPIVTSFRLFSQCNHHHHNNNHHQHHNDDHHHQKLLCSIIWIGDVFCCRIPAPCGYRRSQPQNTSRIQYETV